MFRQPLAVLLTVPMALIGVFVIFVSTDASFTREAYIGVIMSENVDANIWNALGYALIGGLLSSTFFVLTTTPALYLLFERAGRRSTADDRALAYEPVPVEV